MTINQGRGRQRHARLPEYPPRECDHCGKTYRPYKIDARFCSKTCQSRRNSREYYVRTHGKEPDKERECGICGAVFSRDGNWRQRYCSDPCRKEARRRSRQRFMRRNPGYKKAEEFRMWGGWSSTVTRFFRRNPDIPRQCVACGENRVVDIHHKKPRNGVPVRAGNSRPEDVWVLCPNHHAMIHRGVTTPAELGLT